MPVFMMPAMQGFCQVCAVKHDPTHPHNALSLPYQVWFQSTYNRSATWADAIAHCPEEIQTQWRNILKQKNAWTEPKDGKPIATLDKSGGVPTVRPMPNMEPKVVRMEKRRYKKRAKKRK
jgi:hypothetical protein